MCSSFGTNGLLQELLELMITAESNPEKLKAYKLHPKVGASLLFGLQMACFVHTVCVLPSPLQTKRVEPHLPLRFNGKEMAAGMTLRDGTCLCLSRLHLAFTFPSRSRAHVRSSVADFQNVGADVQLNEYVVRVASAAYIRTMSPKLSSFSPRTLCDSHVWMFSSRFSLMFRGLINAQAWFQTSPAPRGEYARGNEVRHEESGLVRPPLRAFFYLLLCFYHAPCPAKTPTKHHALLHIQHRLACAGGYWSLLRLRGGKSGSLVLRFAPVYHLLVVAPLQSIKLGLCVPDHTPAAREPCA